MDRDPGFFRAAAPAAAHVTQLALLVVLGTWAGARLDERFGTAPWLLLLGAGAGMAAGLYQLIRGIKELPSNDESDPDQPT